MTWPKRVEKLTQENQLLSTAERQTATVNERLRGRITELEDELTGVRTSLRRMIKSQSRT